MKKVMSKKEIAVKRIQANIKDGNLLLDIKKLRRVQRRFWKLEAAE